MIQVAPGPGAPMQALTEATAIQGEGLQGDRYQLGTGTFSKARAGLVKRHLTLIEVEALEAVNGELEQPFTFADTRRNVLTSGVSLNGLVGREFMLGEVLVRGHELCTPCIRPSQLSGKPGFREAFAGRGGLRVEILVGFSFRVGAVIAL